MGDKRNARKSTKAQRTPAKSKPVATPSRSPSTRKRRPSVKAAARNRPLAVQFQLEDEGVSQDAIAEDILAELELTPEKNVAAHYAPSDGSKNDSQDYEDFEFDEEFDGSDGDEDEVAIEPGPRRIDFKKNLKKSKNQTRGGMLDILSHKDRDSSYEILQVYLQSKLLIFHLRFLMMADTKNCRFRQGPHGR
jgi:hypothetical protein